MSPLVHIDRYNIEIANSKRIIQIGIKRMQSLKTQTNLKIYVSAAINETIVLYIYRDDVSEMSAGL
jgi:hypothetical protein